MVGAGAAASGFSDFAVDFGGALTEPAAGTCRLSGRGRARGLNELRRPAKAGGTTEMLAAGALRLMGGVDRVRIEAGRLKLTLGGTATSCSISSTPFLCRRCFGSACCSFFVCSAVVIGRCETDSTTLADIG